MQEECNVEFFGENKINVIEINGWLRFNYMHEIINYNYFICCKNLIIFEFGFRV